MQGACDSQPRFNFEETMTEDEMGLGEEEEEERPDPRLFKGDLYTAAVENNLEKVLELLSQDVPATHVDEYTTWTPLHWAANHGNVAMVEAMIDHGATAPYHRMVLRAKREAAKKAEQVNNEAANKVEADLLAAADDDENFKGDGETKDGGNAEENTPTEGGDATTPSGETAEKKNGEMNEATATATATSAATGGDTAATASGDSATVGGEAATTTGGEAAAVATSGDTATAETGAATTADAAATATTNNEDKKQNLADYVDEEDDEDLDYDTLMDRKLETSVDLLKNTPLLWASAKGHLRIVWLLLGDGYDPNQFDDVGNNALHLAASSGSLKTCQVLLDSGTKSTIVNVYKNQPIHMATDKSIKDVLADGMIKGASMTDEDIETKIVANLQKYENMTNELEDAINATNVVGSPRGSTIGGRDIGDVVSSLAKELKKGREWGLRQELIDMGEKAIKKLEMGIELTNNFTTVLENMPVKTQEQFTKYIHSLELALSNAKSAGVEGPQIVSSEEIIHRCKQEYWLSVKTQRLVHVDCALESNEHDMNRLQQAIEKCQALGGSPEIINKAVALHMRLDSELGMTRALAIVPTYRLPKKEGEEYPEGYWEDDDLGHIIETEEYPHPPADTGEYKWEPAVSYTKLEKAINAIKSSYTGAEEKGANAAVVEEAKTKLAKSEKDFKLLKVKDEADKHAAIEHTQKLCKKAKKGKKK